MTTIDTTPTEPPRNWFLDLANGVGTEDLLRHASHLRAKLAYANEQGHRADARAYELRLLDVERAIAVHNRRATEAEEQRQTKLDAGVCLHLAGWTRHLAHTPIEDGQYVDLRVRMSAVASQLEAAAEMAEKCMRLQFARDDAHRDWQAMQIERDAARAEADRLRTQPTLTTDEVRAVVRASIEHHYQRLSVPTMDAIAKTAAEKLAGRTVQPAAIESTLTEERVREVVLAAVRDGDTASASERDAIAARAAKELAGAVVALDAQERAQLTAMLGDGAASDYPAAYQAILRLLAAADAAPRGCPVHDGAIHGGEAEELRAGIEALIADPPGGDLESNREWMLPLQRLLDRVNARDSLGYLERGDAQREADLHEAVLHGCTFVRSGIEAFTELDGEARYEAPSVRECEDAAAEYARSKAGG